MSSSCGRLGTEVEVGKRNKSETWTARAISPHFRDLAFSTPYVNPLFSCVTLFSKFENWREKKEKDEDPAPSDLIIFFFWLNFPVLWGFLQSVRQDEKPQHKQH